MSDAVSRLDASPLRAGAVLAGKYRIERTLGSGGMAAVYAATHLQVGEAVAIKILHGHVLKRQGAIERFLREARVAMRLRSEHVARVYDVGAAADGQPFIVLELLQGADLATLLNERGPSPVATAVDHLLQACQALVEAHTLGVVHRDLKPANLFLCATFDGLPCVKVLDFGISKLQGGFAGENAFGATESSDPESSGGPEAPRAVSGEDRASDAGPAGSLTLTETFLGSPQYMAPEQIRSARDVDARADVWALGVILYELVSGRLPFRAATIEALYDCILTRHPLPLQVPGGAPAGLEEALAICLAKEPSDRYQSVRAFAEAIVGFGSGDARTSLDRIVRMAGGKPGSGVRPRVITPGPPTLASEERRDSVAVAVVTRPPPAQSVVPARARHRSTWLALIATGVAAGAWIATRLPAPGASPPLVVLGPSSASTRIAVAAPPSSVGPSSSPPDPAPAEPRPVDARPTEASPPSGPGRPARPRPRVVPRAEATGAAPASAASSRPADPALHLDTGELFKDRR